MALRWIQTYRRIPIYDEKGLVYSTFTCTTMTEPKCFWYAVAQALGHTHLNDFANAHNVCIDGETIRTVHAEITSRLGINIISILISWNQSSQEWEHFISDDGVKELAALASTVSNHKFIIMLHVRDPRHVDPHHVELLAPGLLSEPPSKLVFSESEPLVQHIIALAPQDDATPRRPPSRPRAVYRKGDNSSGASGATTAGPAPSFLG